MLFGPDIARHRVGVSDGVGEVDSVHTIDRLIKTCREAGDCGNSFFFSLIQSHLNMLPANFQG